MTKDGLDKTTKSIESNSSKEAKFELPFHGSWVQDPQKINVYFLY